MFVGMNYVTNEVKGSFWRPHDYMAKVPQAHVTGLSPEINVTISEEGMMLSKQMVARNDEADKVFESEDGVVRHYEFNIHTGDLAMVGM